MHNQRIERLWRDVPKEVTSHFYNLFYSMEDKGRLNPDNAIHRYALHKVFLQLINHKLDTFRTAWNNHRMRTVHNRTTNQLWTESNRSTCSRSRADLVGSEELGDVPNFVQTLLQRMNASRANYHHDDEAVQEQPDTSLNISLSAEQEHEIASELSCISDTAAKYEWCIAKLEAFDCSRSDI